MGLKQLMPGRGVSHSGEASRVESFPSGSNLTLTWNVVSSGLLSNTNLANPNGWTPVTGATTSPFVTPIPKTGNLFYKIAP